MHRKSELPKKKSKAPNLTQGDKQKNQELAIKRRANENITGMIKRCKIIADKYRNRRKRLGLRFPLIFAIYDMELPK
ncbi:hypothetical protein K737_300408 [Holospora undulata HU1]|uniref:DDE Tnp4 domain-containing protein n=1 Tax=Holospora undulata HU1 TaxID=1321371 RepID=A0A061JIU1_9PROT|nr:hypothetical protein K737_300408 [Holospora undulata HU1]